jgi:hypothetical protein
LVHKFKRKKENPIKEISKTNIDKLVKAGIIKNTHSGYVNRNGNPVGFYRSVHKRWIEDRYADKANEL